MKFKERLKTRKFWSNAFFYLFVVLMLFPSSRKAIQVQIVRISTFAPSLNNNSSHHEKIAEGDWSMKLLTENGDIIDLEDLRNKSLFVNIWATWCPPCVAEMPSINELFLEVNNMNFALISREPIEKLKSFKQSRGYNFPVFQMMSASPERLSRSNSIPATYILSADGKLLLEHQGAKNWSSNKFIKELLPLI